jgi:hypothetical protein
MLRTELLVDVNFGSSTIAIFFFSRWWSGTSMFSPFSDFFFLYVELICWKMARWTDAIACSFIATFSYTAYKSTVFSRNLGRSRMALYTIKKQGFMRLQRDINPFSVYYSSDFLVYAMSYFQRILSYMRDRLIVVRSYSLRQILGQNMGHYCVAN